MSLVYLLCKAFYLFCSSFKMVRLVIWVISILASVLHIKASLDVVRSGAGEAVPQVKAATLLEEYKEWPLSPVVFNHPIQSPVDIITTKAVLKDLPTLSIIQYDLQGGESILHNNGHTVVINLKDLPSNRLHLKGGPLKDKFVVDNVHMYWGQEDIWGSPHLVDGEGYSAEFHLVYYNTKYSSYERAAKKPDGIAVLTVFAEAIDEDNSLLDPLVKALSNVTAAGSSTTLDSSDAMQWVSSALSLVSDYYAYPGSLTTPPHSENAVYIIPLTPITLSHKQLRALRDLRGEDGARIQEHGRPVQPLHRRPVVRSSNVQLLIGGRRV